MSSCPICATVHNPGENACPTCGFRFTDATQQFKPVAINIDSYENAIGCSNASLQEVRGPQIGSIYALKEADITIGRDPECDIFLNDMTVSRMHARILLTDKGYAISDEHSYNGVWVNNQSVEIKVLENNDVIQIGVFCFVYRVD